MAKESVEQLSEERLLPLRNREMPAWRLSSHDMSQVEPRITDMRCVLISHVPVEPAADLFSGQRWAPLYTLRRIHRT